MKTCPGFDVDGKPFKCDNKPGTAWGPIWCAECNERRLERLSNQFNQIVSLIEQTGNKLDKR